MRVFIAVLLASPFLLANEVVGEKPVRENTAIHLDVEKYQLPNGLTVLLHQERSVPVVSYQTWFKVGSKDEEPGYTGIAHLFEHMMFKGAKRYTNSEFDKVLRKTGANYNAFTSQDYTGYYIDLPSEKIELAIDLESDRLEFLQLNQDNLTSEREVVKEERRYRYNTSIMGTLFEETFAQFFKVHPYRWPVIGWMEDLNQITVEQCQKFFKQFYSTNNAVVVVAGDFDKSNVKKLIEKYYGHMKPSVIVRPNKSMENPLVEKREKVVEKEIQSEIISLTYGVPAQGADESYVLDLISNILSEGSSSRLYKKVVRESRLADSVGATNYSLQDQGLFIFTANMKSQSSAKDREKVLSIVEGEVWRLKNQLVPLDEIEKSKTQVMKSYIDSLKTINGRGRLLAQGEVYFGDYKRVFQDLEKYNAITPEQIKAIAKKYLNKDKSSLVVVTRASKKKTAKNIEPRVRL